MQRSPTTRRRTAAAGKPLRRELSPDRAFVLQLDRQARPPRRIIGRVEHITSGQVAHVTCLRELLAFLTKVLRHQASGGEAPEGDQE